MINILRAAVTIVFMCVSVSAYADEAPSQSVIDKLLTDHFTNKTYATRIYELTVESVKRGKPREGNYRTDGTPANRPTEVVPCKVVWTRLTKYTSGDAKTVRERFTGEYVFFLDEFDEWTFRIKDQKGEPF
jgi:hypothetical protein